MTRVRLGEILIQEGKLDTTQLQAALAYQRRWGKKMGECLVQLGFISEVELCHTLSKALRIPLIDITKIDPGRITRELLNHITIQSARANRLVPIALKEIRHKKRLVVATSDPTNYRLFDELQFKSGYPLLVMVAPDSDVEWFIRRYYMGETETLPINYISGINVMDDETTEGAAIPDPISSIFWDANFTGITNFGSPTASGKDEKNKKKR